MYPLSFLEYHSPGQSLLKEEKENLSVTDVIIILGSGLVGALAYTFSDTFWFSAVEGEVYAFSSFLTALVFWMILRWQDESDTVYGDRWIILIAYIIGLSIGVHLLESALHSSDCTGFLLSEISNDFA